MSAEEHRAAAPGVLGFGLITVSDSRAKADDVSGRLLREGVVAARHLVVETVLGADDVAMIRAAVGRRLEQRAMIVVVAPGGTGFSSGDLTVEAVAPLFDR